MSEDDAWRRQLADARYGDALTPGFARKTNMDLVGPRRSVPPKLVFSPSLGADDQRDHPMPSMPALALAVPPELRPDQSKQVRAGRVWWFGTGLLAIAAAATFGRGTKPPQHQPEAQIAALIHRQPPAKVAPSTFRVFAKTSGNPSPVIVAHIEPVTNKPASNHPRATKKTSPTISGVEPIAPPSERLSSPVSLPPRSDRSRPSQAPSTLTQAQKSPSFQCHAGQGEITSSICADQTLAALDRKLAARFAALDDSVDPATVEALHHGETTFLNSRQLCLNKSCLVDVYRERLRDLDALKP